MEGTIGRKICLGWEKSEPGADLIWEVIRVAEMEIKIAGEALKEEKSKGSISVTSGRAQQKTPHYLKFS